MKTILPALFFVLAASGAAYAAHRLAGARRHGGERGDFWTTVVSGSILILSPTILLSGWLETLWPAWYQSGRHFYLDLTGAFGWPLATCYLVALGVPLAVWLALLLFGLRRLPEEPSAVRWLAGGVGFNNSRRWLLLCALPLLVAAALTLPRLGTGPAAHPAAAWASFVLLGLGLLGVSSGQGAVEAGGAHAGRDAQIGSASSSWPETLAGAGVRSRPLISWPGRAQRRSLPSPSARRLASRLRLMGARAVAPQLVETLDELLRTRGESTRAFTRLIQAPDHCGQVEIVALAAHLLDRRYRTHTLVVTVDDAEELARRIGRWLPTGGVAVIERSTEIPPKELVWVVEAEVLSNRLIPQLQEPRSLERLGLVVWWDLHQYSGILAAHLWAISRRLHRLLQAHGRPELHTLAFVRGASDPDAQLMAFAQRLLPIPLDREAVIDVTVEGPQQVDLHLLETQGLAPGSSGRSLPLALSVARASMAGGWKTCLDLSPELRDPATSLRELEPSSLGEWFCQDSAEARARIHPLTAAEVLSLREIFAQGGRAGEGIHHVGLVVPAGNPYVHHLLDRLTSGKDGNGFGTSRRLLWAQAGGELIRRHLLLALSELPDTRRGLLRHFLLDEELVRHTLGEIAEEGNLTRREVRHLDRGNRLVIDHRYQIRRQGDRSERPLETFGSELVDVRDPAAGGGVRLRIDRERLTIDAYPHKVFFAAGDQRFRIDEWHSVADVVARGWLACTREDEDRRTWRRRHSTVFDVTSLGSPVTVGSRGRSFVRFAADLCYEEEVTGVLQITPDPARSTWPKPESRLLDEPIHTSFMTRALVLGFRRPSGKYEELAPISLCEALRHVLPVHLGVEEDALELVPLWGEETSEGIFGLALVDLYPGGIGLIDAVQGDDPLLAQILRRTRDWLATCSCRGGRGCCLDTPGGRAAALDALPDHRAALELLRQVV